MCNFPGLSEGHFSVQYSLHLLTLEANPSILCTFDPCFVFCLPWFGSDVRIMYRHIMYIMENTVMYFALCVLLPIPLFHHTM